MTLSVANKDGRTEQKIERAEQAEDPHRLLVYCDNPDEVGEHAQEQDAD